LDSISEAASLGLEHLRMQTGHQISFDLKKDLGNTAFAVTPPNGRRFQFVALLAGKFDSEPVYRVVAEKIDEAKRATYADYELFAAGDGEEEVLLGILDGRVVVAGTERWAKMAIDNYKAGSQGVSAIHDRLKDLGGSIKVSVSKALLPDDLWTFPPLQPMNITGENVKSIGFSITFHEVQTIGAEYQAIIGFDSPESAGAVQRAVQFYMGAAKAAQPISRMILDDIVVDTQKEILTLKADAGGDMTGIASTSILAGMLMPALSGARQEARKAKCMANLRQIGIGLVQYIDSVGEHRFLPPSLKALMDKEIITEPGVYVCPVDQTAAPGWYCSYESIFDLTEKKLTDRLPLDTMMVWDSEPRHRGGRNVLFFDGHVEYLREADFQKALAKLKEYLEKLK